MEPTTKNRRKHSEAFAYFLVIVGAALFSAILVAIVGFKPDTGISSILQNWGTIILTGIIIAAASFQFGSSKGSAVKDEIAAANAASPPPPPIVLTTAQEAKP